MFLEVFFLSFLILIFIKYVFNITLLNVLDDFPISIFLCRGFIAHFHPEIRFFFCFYVKLNKLVHEHPPSVTSLLVGLRLEVLVRASASSPVGQTWPRQAAWTGPTEGAGRKPCRMQELAPEDNELQPEPTNGRMPPGPELQGRNKHWRWNPGSHRAFPSFWVSEDPPLRLRLTDICSLLETSWRLMEAPWSSCWWSTCPLIRSFILLYQSWTGSKVQAFLWNYTLLLKYLLFDGLKAGSRLNSLLCSQERFKLKVETIRKDEWHCRKKLSDWSQSAETSVFQRCQKRLRSSSFVVPEWNLETSFLGVKILQRHCRLSSGRGLKRSVSRCATAVSVLLSHTNAEVELLSHC